MNSSSAHTSTNSLLCVSGKQWYMYIYVPLHMLAYAEQFFIAAALFHSFSVVGQLLTILSVMFGIKQWSLLPSTAYNHMQYI